MRPFELVTNKPKNRALLLITMVIKALSNLLAHAVHCSEIGGYLCRSLNLYFSPYRIGSVLLVFESV